MLFRSRERAEAINRQVVRFARERNWPQEVAAARVQLALLALANGEVRRVREEVEAAEGELGSAPRHALWLHVGMLRAVLGAEAGDERGCRAWWAVARERGIEERHVPDLWLPLERLGMAARRNGWEDIAKRALRRLQTDTSAEAVVVEDDG